MVSAIGSYASIIRTQWQFEENEDFFEVKIGYSCRRNIGWFSNLRHPKNRQCFADDCIFIMKFTRFSIKIHMCKNPQKESISSQIQLDTFMGMQFTAASLHQ